MKYLFLLFLVVMAGCVGIKYEQDIGFMSSAVANSPEYLMKLNGTVCRDTDGMIGFCAKRVKSNQDLLIDILPQQYAYTFKLDCTDTLNVDTSFSVPIGVPLKHTIPYSRYYDMEVFNCTIDIIPGDRPLPIAAFAAFRVMVVDANYVSMDSVSVNGGYLILGRHSYLSNVDGTNYNKKVWLKEDGQKAITVESYVMRFAYRGL